MTILPHNIFYTDDDADDQAFFIDAVRDVSSLLEVTTQSDGDELLTLLHNPPPKPSLLFLDLNMPVKNGFEVLKEIRESEQTRDLPVIIFSTSDNEEAVNRTRALGANLYVTKPTSYSKLKKVIMHSLSIDWNTFSASVDDYHCRIN